MAGGCRVVDCVEGGTEEVSVSVEDFETGWGGRGGFGEGWRWCV